jgi:hypothetical protein
VKELIAALEAGLRPALEAGRVKPETVVDLPRGEFERELGRFAR